MKKPKFQRQLGATYKRLVDKWRKPRGMQSKMRKHKKGKGAMPSISYGTPKELRFLHPSGFREVIIHNVKDLEKVDSGKEAVKISHSVGNKKRREILKKTEEMKIKVLNP